MSLCWLSRCQILGAGTLLGPLFLDS
jgi:hypothetical protein